MSEREREEIEKYKREVISQRKEVKRSSKFVLSDEVVASIPTGGSISLKQKVSVAYHFALEGNMAAAADVAGVHVATAYKWRDSTWFVDCVKEFQERERIRLDAMFTKIANKSTEEMLERLENGNEVYVNGELKRLKVPFKDLASYGVKDVIQMRQLLRGEVTSRKEVKTTDRLKELAASFREMAVKGEVMDIRVTDE